MADWWGHTTEKRRRSTIPLFQVGAMGMECPKIAYATLSKPLLLQSTILTAHCLAPSPSFSPPTTWFVLCWFVTACKIPPQYAGKVMTQKNHAPDPDESRASPCAWASKAKPSQANPPSPSCHTDACLCFCAHEEETTESISPPPSTPSL